MYKVIKNKFPVITESSLIKLVLICIGLISILFISVADGAVVNIEPMTVRDGDTFQLQVTVDPQGTPIAGMQMGLNFNPDMVHVNGVTMGNLFTQSGYPVFNGNTTPLSNYNTGIYYSVIVGNSSTSTQGSFMIINVTALAPSNSMLWTATDQKIASPAGQSVAIQNTGGSLVIALRYDLNMDGVINIQDLVLLGQAFNSQSQYDLDGDMLVTIYDIVLIAAQI